VGSAGELRISPVRPAVSARPGADNTFCAGAGVWVFLWLAAPALAAPQVAAPPTRSADSVSVSLYDTRGGCHAQGWFHAPVSVAIAWQVLTDYEGITRIVRAVRESRLERGPDGERRLRQDAVGSAFFMHHRVHVLLQLDEVAFQRIGFRDVLGRDFRTYAGAWRVVPDTAGVRIEYELSAEPRSPMLRVFCRGSLLRGAEDLLGQMRDEMLRRQAMQQP